MTSIDLIKSFKQTKVNLPAASKLLIVILFKASSKES